MIGIIIKERTARVCGPYRMMKPRRKTKMADLPRRKPIRLRGYDYSRAGCYFITICVQDRHEILCEIVTDVTVGTAHPGGPSSHLTETGVMVDQYIIGIPAHYRYVVVDKYVIMPNHIHMILRIEDGPDTWVISTSKNGPPGCAVPTSLTKSAVAKIINAFKSLTSRQFGESMWQPRSYDHIIRDANDYSRIWQYIDTNPQNWLKDVFYGPVKNP